MTRFQKLLLSAALAPAALLAQYSYTYTDSLTSINGSIWAEWGTVDATSGGLTGPGGGGTLGYYGSLGGPTGEYEVATTITLGSLCTSSCGTYVSYLNLQGNYYSVELQNPHWSGGVCLATLAMNKYYSSTLTTLTSTTISCHSGMVIRAIHTFSGQLVAYVDNVFTLWAQDFALSTGIPGIGAYGTISNDSMALVQIGQLDQVAPNPFNMSLIGTSSFSNRVDIQSPGTTDNTGGTGIMMYRFIRNSTYMADATSPDWSDTAVSPSTTYTYQIWVYDYHLNVTYSSTFNVTTPPSGGVDPRRVGVRPTGAYWGASPEQIDLLSGNLSYSLPLLKAQGRNGWGIGFALSYNSQNWRKDSGGTWDLGRDVGYGYGWKLLAGSLTPYWDGCYYLDHWTFTDSTGAEYRLTNKSGGVWTSTESVYLSYDSNAGILHFPDGSFWTMGAVSAGSEQDAGTYYPTVMEDTNGNQVLINYAAGVGTWWTNSSARITTIEDVRAVNDGYGHYWTYQFSYDGGHLTGIANSIGTGESYSFSYYSASTLYDPFAESSYGSVKFLQYVNVLANSTNYSFLYDRTASPTSGTLSKVTLPYQGFLSWASSNATYTGSRIQQEVGTRYLSADGSTYTTYPFNHESNTSSLTIHACTSIDDPAGLGEKYWAFSASGANIGLVTHYQGRAPSGNPCYSTPASTAMTQNDFGWTQDAAGNNYLGQVNTIADPGTSNAITKAVTQEMDAHGNVTLVGYYDWGNLTTAARTYNYSYLSSGSYPSLYIFNRLTSATVTSGSTNLTLATISYDGNGLTGSATPREWDSSYGSVTTRGNATSIMDVSGNTTTVYYDKYGNTVSTTVNGVPSTASVSSTTNYAAPDSITVNSTLTTSMSYSSFLGLTNETGPNGTSVDIGYDSVGRPGSSTSPFGATTYNVYNDTASPPNTCTSVNTRWTQTFLDGLGRALKVLTGSYSSSGPTTCSSASGATTLTRTDITYGSCGCSPLGKMMSQTVPYTYGGSVGASTTYTYDGIGRTLTVTTGGSDTTGTATYSYAGNTVTATDAAGKVKVFTMDAFGNLTQVAENPSGLDYISTYTYDLLNHLTGVSMTRSTGTQTRSFVYSGNYLISAANPENGTVNYTYNSYGKVATRTDAKNQQAAYTYDSYARLTEVQRSLHQGGTTISVAAYGTPLSGVYPTMTLSTGPGETILGTWTVTGSLQNYVVSTDINLYGWNLYVTLTNYASSSGVTRELYVNSIKVTTPSGSSGGIVFYSTDPSVYSSCAGGDPETTLLNCNGYFLYQSAAYGGTAGSYVEDTCQREVYTYGTDPSTYSLGRLVSIQYWGGYDPSGGACDTAFTETYTYGQPGAPVGKQLGVNRGSSGVNLSATFAYDNEGRMTGETYPTDVNNSTANLSYTFDSMGRLYSMTDNLASQQIIQSAYYGPANELTGFTGGSYLGARSGESRTYNSLKQLTELTSGGVSIQYNYPSTGNNGKIASQTDLVSGEQVSYTYDALNYDALNRLATAKNQSTFTPLWGQSFTYDGFGNLTGTSVTQGSAPTLTASYDANNHAGGEDANGNPPSIELPAYGYPAGAGYDVENRMVSLNAGFTGGPLDYYSYAPGNKRVWRGSWTYTYSMGTYTYTRGTDEITFWSVSGQKLATYALTTTTSLIATQTGTNYYFGGKLIKNANGWVYSDRLASIGKFYPYGIERPSATTNGTEKFTGYFRDSETGNDYAVNRYVSPGNGRFITPDTKTGSSSNPGTWNKYAYAGGDPANNVDPSGQDWCSYDDPSYAGCDGVGPDDNGTCYILDSLGGEYELEGVSGCETYVDDPTGVPTGGGTSPGGSMPPFSGPSTGPLSFGPGGGAYFTNTGTAWDVLVFQNPALWDFAVGFCVAQPEVCVAGAGATAIYTIFVAAPGVQTLFNDISQWYKKRTRLSAKQRVTNAPSWIAYFPPPRPGQSCQQWAAQILNEQYGAGSQQANVRGPGTEYNQIVKRCQAARQ